MALIRLMVTLLLMAVAGHVAAGGVEIRQFDDPVMEQRYRSLTASMRCPLCENQAINDSDSPIAADMRERVYQLLQDDQSDIEITHHMVQRFGEYVLYNPRLENRTYLLWGLPIGLLLVSVVVVGLLVRTRRHASAKALSVDERARLDALLNRKRSS